MRKLSLLLLMPLLWLNSVSAEISEWYREGIIKFVESATVVVRFKVVSTELTHSDHIYNFYQINGQTLEVLKGEIADDACYTIQSEGEFGNPAEDIGKERIAILSIVKDGHCSFIDNLMSTPASTEYLNYFKSIINKEK